MGDWSDLNQVPEGYRAELLAWKHQWEINDGFQHTISDAQLLEGAREGVDSIQDLGGFLWRNGWADTNKPWTGVGMDRAQFYEHLGNYAAHWALVTGQVLNVDDLARSMTTNNFNDPATRIMWNALKANVTSYSFTPLVMNDEAVRQTYGWVKYGLDYNAFEQRRQDMNTAFGMQVSDAFATQQLQYFHRDQGMDNMAMQRDAQQPQKETSQADSPVR